MRSYELRMTNYEAPVRHPSGRRVLKRFGFTLVELMVVVVILGVLATVVTVSVNDYLIKGKQSAAKTEIAQISNALELFFTEFDRYPDNDEGLALLTKPSTGHPQGILKGDLLDPWGNGYLYVHPGIHGAFDVCSYGANKQPGGTGGDLDICNYDTQKNP
jgi:general secretion pathway protein G